MTRNTITKAKAIVYFGQTRSFATNAKVNHKEATQGKYYFIRFQYFYLTTEERIHFVRSENEAMRFSTYQEARQFFYKNRKVIRTEKRNQLNEYSWMVDEDIVITGMFDVYHDISSGNEVLSLTEAYKFGKNLIFIKNYDNDFRTRYLLDDENNRWFTVEKEENSLLFQLYRFIKDESDNLHLTTVLGKQIRLYKNGRAFYVTYNKKTRCYEDDKVADSYEAANNYLGAHDLTGNWGEMGARYFNQNTKEIFKEFGIPKYFHDGRYQSLSKIETFYDLGRGFILSSSPCSDGETKICKEISEALKDIPFDVEHAVVKVKNGYVLRIGKINQIYEVEEENYLHRLSLNYYSSDREGHYGVISSKLISEECVEFTRLFISNNFSTRSLSTRVGPGRWAHDGIHLIHDLFPDAPKQTELGIDIDKNNTEALKMLYTVHPKLKYMKKYMEKHPSVLKGRNCVNFLRALFQYDKIIETMIALGKDGLFWSKSTYDNKTVENFEFYRFVEQLDLTHVPQRGDFYQRLGMTKQQFKLLNEGSANMIENWDIIRDCRFKIPNSNDTICLGRDWSHTDRPNFKLVSFEDLRLVIEIIKCYRANNSDFYYIGNHVSQLYNYYGSYKRVYKALCEKSYDPSTLEDYLRMRQQLEQSQFPDYKASVWDIFPDDNEDLTRYHNRIMFLYEEKQNLDSISSYYRFGESKSDLYLALKEHSITAVQYKEMTDKAHEAADRSAGRLNDLSIIKNVPTSLEEFESMKENVEKEYDLFYRLWNMYYDTTALWPGNCTRRQAYERWGCTYEAFVEARFANNLDIKQYDLYLRLRAKFQTNATDFDVSKYPLKIQTPEELQRLYNELSAKEPDLQAFINERNRQIREAKMRENESSVAKQNELYLKRYKKLKKLGFAPEGDERCIIVPKNLVTLIIEGQTLHHCVGSFVDAVSEGKNTIVFLRKKEDIDAPYVTVSLLQSGDSWFIDQAHGDHNSDISNEDVTFLKRWATVSNVRVDSVHTHYGAKCHN